MKNPDRYYNKLIKKLYKLPKDKIVENLKNMPEDERENFTAFLLSKIEEQEALIHYYEQDEGISCIEFPKTALCVIFVASLLCAAGFGGLAHAIDGADNELIFTLIGTTLAGNVGLAAIAGGFTLINRMIVLGKIGKLVSKSVKAETKFEKCSLILQMIDQNLLTKKYNSETFEFCLRERMQKLPIPEYEDQRVQNIPDGFDINNDMPDDEKDRENNPWLYID